MTTQPSDQEIISTVKRFSSVRGQGILANLLAFSRVLKDLGLRVGLSQVIEKRSATSRVI